MGNTDEDSVTELFDEYRRAREEGLSIEPGPLLARAGAAKSELESRIRVFEQLSKASRDIRRRVEQRDRPRSLGRFRIERTLGRGGLSRVYLALDPKLGRTVALKVLDRSLVSDAAERQWILNEARSLARLAHPCVVQVFDVGEADGFDFVELEHVTGPTLAQVLRALRSVCGAPEAPSSPTSEALRIARGLQGVEARVHLLKRLAAALAYCHNRGVIHRDIKPDNVVLDRDGTPKLVDFGLAHQAETGGERPAITEAFIGTRAYLAPEQVEGKRTGADPRSDQFSFATLAWEFLALSHPFAGGNDAETEAAVRAANPERLRRRNRAVSRELETVIHHALERQPDARYPNLQALAEDLQAVLERRPIAAMPPSLARRGLLFAQRHRALTTFAGLGGAAVLGLATMSVLRERMRILDALALVDPRAPSDPVTFFDAERKLIQIRSEAEVFDDGLLNRLTGALLPHVEATSLALSEHLNEVFSAIDPQEREDTWHFVFDIDLVLNPALSRNGKHQRLGTVGFAPPPNGMELRLQRMEAPLRPFSVVLFKDFTRAPEGRLRLPAGAYRVLYARGRDEPLAGELDLVVTDGWAAPRDLAWRAPDLGLHEESLRVPRGHLENAYPPFPPSPSTLPAFRILPRLITDDEFLRFLEETHWKPCFRLPRPGSPAWVDLESAERFCAWAGGRLPSNEELWSAWMREGLSFEFEDWAPEYKSTSEWVRNQQPDSLNGCHFFPASLARDQQPGVRLNPGVRRTMPAVGPQKVGVGFRIAFPDDVARIYLEPSAQPK